MLKWAHYARKLDIGSLCPNMEIRTGAPKNGIFQFFSFLWEGLQISLLTSPQPPPEIKFKLSYATKRDFGLCPNMDIPPQAPKNGVFRNFFIFVERSPDFAFNESSTTPDIKFKSSYARKRDYAQIWKFSPKLPKMEFFKINSFFLNGLQISPPTSPQPPPDIKFKSSYARKRDFGLLCPHMEIRPQAPKNRIFQKIFHFSEKIFKFHF